MPDRESDRSSADRARGHSLGIARIDHGDRIGRNGQTGLGRRAATLWDRWSSGPATTGDSSDGSWLRMARSSRRSSSPGSSPSSRRAADGRSRTLPSFGLPPGAIEGEHQLSARCSRSGCSRTSSSSSGTSCACRPARGPGDALLERGQPLLFEPARSARANDPSSSARGGPRHRPSACLSSSAASSAGAARARATASKRSRSSVPSWTRISYREAG